MNLDDERLPDVPGDGSHIHSLDRCEHYTAGQEVGWLCGRFPMFTNIATANAAPGQVDDGDVVSIDYNDVTDAWEVVLRHRQGGRLVVGCYRSSQEATLWRDGIAEVIGSWFHDHTMAPTAQDLADYDEQAALDQRAEVIDLAGIGSSLRDEDDR